MSSRVGRGWVRVGCPRQHSLSTPAPEAQSGLVGEIPEPLNGWWKGCQRSGHSVRPH